MKKLFLPFMLLVMLTATTSCKNEEIQKKNVQNEYEEVGILHNQFLDSVLLDLWMTKIGLFETGDKTGIKATNSLQITKEQAIGISFKTVTRCLKTIAPKATDEQIALLLPADLQSSQKSSCTDSFTAVQNRYYSKLANILNKKNITVDDAIAGIYNLEEDISMNVAEEEKQPLLSMTAVARHSAKYWNEKFAEWNMALHGKVIDEVVPKESSHLKSEDPNILKQLSDLPPGYYPHPSDKTQFFYVTDYGTVIRMTCPDGLHFDPETCKCDWPKKSWFRKELATSDAKVVSSTVIGATAGAVVGVIASADGIGAIPGAVGGAVTNSVANAILQLFK
ncbi:MAG: hypothetical protein LBR26_14180 [Prevotella sp.]|jgi:hypothetical protein|nr:hypothetical protein [Prevotella sp.]